MSSPHASGPGRPGYADFRDMIGLAERHAPAFAAQILSTCADDLPVPVAGLDVLDVGSGYGAGAAELARRCGSVVGIEPMPELHAVAERRTPEHRNLSFRQQAVEQLDEVDAYDLVVLDNVFEHLPDQAEALRRISRALRPGGVVYLLMPNRLWPVEVHYQLPFLAWLPLPLANRYLRMSGRGTDYSDASHEVTLWGLRRRLEQHTDWAWRLTLPADPAATHLGTPWHYRAGMRVLERWPAAWAVSKSFLVVAKAP